MDIPRYTGGVRSIPRYIQEGLGLYLDIQERLKI